MQNNPLEVVEGYFAAFNDGGIEQMGQFLSDDFRAVSPPPLAERDKFAFLEAVRPLKTALPDVRISLTDVKVAGNIVTVTEETLGTFTRTLDLSGLGLPAIPPSGKAARMPDQRVEFTVLNGKITQARNITPSEEAGLPGMLKALGVKP